MVFWLLSWARRMILREHAGEHEVITAELARINRELDHQERELRDIAATRRRRAYREGRVPEP